MDSKEGINEKDAKHYFCQMIYAVEYLHSNKICHHDLKPQNILIDSENNIRIIDFGLSVNFEDKEEMNKNYGSPRFAAPELFQGKIHTEKVDIWSLGVILYKLFVGYFPFNKPDLEDLIHQIVNDEVSVPESLDPGLRDLIMGMLDKNQEKRFSIQDIKENSWFKEASSSDETLKQEDFAGTRPSLQDLKSKITIKRIPRISSLKGLRLERTNTLEKLVASGDFKRITSEPAKKHHRNSIPIDLLK